MAEEIARRNPGLPKLGPEPGSSALVALRMANDQRQQMKRAAAEAGIPVSELLRRALDEKLARETEMKAAVPELLAEARKMKPRGISDAAWNQIIRDQIAKIGKPKKPQRTLTDEKTARRMLLEEAARFHAAGAPEKEAQLLAEYRERYKTDPAFRAEIDAGVKESLAQAERLKARTLPLGTSEGSH